MLAHVLARSKDLAIISNEFDQLVHTGGVCLYTMILRYSGLPPNVVLDQAGARHEYSKAQNRIMKTIAVAFEDGLKKTPSIGQLNG